MAKRISGDAPGVAVGPVDGTRTFLHRYEIVGNALVRRRVADRRPLDDVEARLIDVLVNEDEVGRYIHTVRGIVVHERDLARLAPAADLIPWREFDVGVDLMLEIGKDLDVGPHRRPVLRLATSHGVHVA